MEPADHVEMPYDVLACWADPAELVEVEDACGSPDSPLLGSALEVPRSVDEVDGLESWELLLLDGTCLEAELLMDSLALVVVEAALVRNQSLEVHLLSRKLLDGLCLLLEGLS